MDNADPGSEIKMRLGAAPSTVARADVAPPLLVTPAQCLDELG